MARRQLSGSASRLSRAAIYAVGAFLLGIAVAAVISSVQTARTAPKVADTDYVVMVADLFDHEKSIFNARERLLQVGKDPLDMAEAALERKTKESPPNQRDVDSLRQLAQGLRQAANDQPVRQSSGPGFVVLIALILASVVLAAGAAWIWKQLEMRGLRVPKVPGARPAGAPLLAGLSGRALMQRGMSAAATFANRRPSAIRERPAADDVDDLGQEPAPRQTRARPRPVVEPVEPAPVVRRARPAPTSEHGGAMQSLQARYQLGDEEFDEIHPIVDAQGELIGACGLSATENSGRPGRFYGFTAWLQAYGPQNDLAAVGLVSRSGQLARSAAIAEWERRGTIDEVRQVERGMQIELNAHGVRARLTVLDFDYAAPANGSPGYFGRLTVRYDVTPTR
jgi:hypothetical protein